MRYYHKCTCVLLQTTHYSRQILMKAQFSPQIFKIFKYEISWKSVQRETSYSIRTDRKGDGQTWRRLIITFRYFSNGPKKRLHKALNVSFFTLSLSSFLISWQAEHYNLLVHIFGFQALSQNCEKQLTASTCLSEWNNLASTVRIFMKFDIRTLFDNLSRKFLIEVNENCAALCY